MTNQRGHPGQQQRHRSILAFVFWIVPVRQSRWLPSVSLADLNAVIAEIPHKIPSLEKEPARTRAKPCKDGCRGAKRMKVFSRVVFVGVFLTFCGCAQFVQYPPTDKGWVKLNAHDAARLEPLLAQTPSLAHASYDLPPDLKIVIDPVYGTNICDGRRALRLDFAGKWRIWDAWPWFGPSGGIGGGQVVIYLRAAGAAYYRFYPGPMIIPGDRPDVKIAAACDNPSRYFGQLQNKPDDPMSAQVRFRQ